MKSFSILLILSLWPAILAAQPGVITVATGVSGTHSAAHVVSDQSGHTFLAEARILRHGPNQAFIVEIGQRYDGDGALQMAYVVQSGRRLDFEPAWRAEPFCSGVGVCSGHRIGTLFMSQEAFEAGATRGLNVDLSGPGGAFQLALPAELFAEARERAAWLD